MRYFTIMTGLRGCYMPDNSYTVACKTRRELKAYLEDEAYSVRDAGMVGCSKRAIAWLAAIAWRDYKKPAWTLPYVSEYGHKAAKPNYAFGIMVSKADRNEYKAYLADNA